MMSSIAIVHLKNTSTFIYLFTFFSLAFLQVFCVSNFFEQPVDPVVSQEEEASHTTLQESPSNGNHYGSTDWIWGLKDNTVLSLYPLILVTEDLKYVSELQDINFLCISSSQFAPTLQPLVWSVNFNYWKKSVLQITVLALYWVIKMQKFLPSFWVNPP